MQAKDVLIPARRELQDDFGVKFPDLVLFGFLADGIAELLRMRPDLLLGVSGEMGSEALAGGGGEGTFIRIRSGRLEVWDEGLEQWLAVKFEHGALVPMVINGGEEPGEIEDVVADLSWDADIGVDGFSFVAPLTDYVVFRGLRSQGRGEGEQEAALSRYGAFRARIGVDREGGG